VPLFAALLIALAGCRERPDQRPGPDGNERAIVSNVVEVTVESRVDFSSLPGTVFPVQRARIAPRIAGEIQEISVDIGSKVSAGNILARIASRDLEARVDQARSLVDATNRELARERVLVERAASPFEAVLSAEERLRSAEARLHEAQAALDFTIIRAPFAGTIATRLARSGDFATAGVPVLELHGSGRHEIELAVPESLARNLSPGVALPVEIEVTGVSFTALVSEISSATDPEARAVLVKLTVPADAPVRSGDFARVRVPGPVRDAIVVPESAIAPHGQVDRIFVLSPENRAVLRLVRVGERKSGRAEILAGLNPGERILDAPGTALRDGQRVDVPR
jgi:membrane fusion protein, multidrug efflux system